MTFEEWLDTDRKGAGCSWRVYLTDLEKEDMEKCWDDATRNAREECTKLLEPYFTSGNDIPVERATIPASLYHMMHRSGATSLD